MTVQSVVLAALLTVLVSVLPPPAFAAVNPVRACQKALDRVSAALLQKTVRTVQGCLARKDSGRLAPLAECIGERGSVSGISDGVTRDKILAAITKARLVIAKKCAGVDLFAPLPDGLGFPLTCPSGLGCGGLVLSREAVADCVVCNQVAAAQFAVAVARAGQPPLGPPAGGSCPSQLTIEGQGEDADLDTGWTGVAFDQKTVGKGTLTVALDCPNAAPPCGSCTVSGPIANATSTNNQRCISDTSVECTNGTPSGACSGGCAFFFGAPLSLSSGGVPVCVQNRVNGAITGTSNPQTGANVWQATLISSVFNGLLVDKPCPTCSGASFGATGTCSDGPRVGQPCTVDGTSQFFGNTSFDCPPNPGANIGNLNIALNPTTGTSTLNPSASTACDTFPFIGTDCFCSGQDKANDCADGVCTADATGEGECASGPTQGFCQPTEPFRSCNNDGECPALGDSCVFGLRKCGGQSEVNPGPPLAIDVTGPIQRTGTPNVNNPVLASTFCIAAVSASAVNQAAGLPGPGALLLPSKTCYQASCTFP